MIDVLDFVFLFFYVVVEWGPVVRGSQVGAVCVFLFSCTFPGCRVSVSMGPAHLQVLLVDFHLARWESLFFSSSQHSSSVLVRCFLPHFLQTCNSLYFFLRPSRFFFFFSSGFFLASFFLLLMRDSICFIASVVLLMRVSICCVCFSV